MTDTPDIAQLAAECAALIDAAPDSAALEDQRIALLGKKGRVTELLKALGTLPPEQRKDYGAAVNVLKQDVTAKLDARRATLDTAALESRLATERVDVSLPVRQEDPGAIHPISQTIAEITALFGAMGFAVKEGPDLESDFYNFTALNMPPDHPARQMQDSFYLPAQDGGEPPVMRTHTSPVQIRTLLSEKPPLRIIVPGRTFRYDNDQTHTPTFHQVEGLVVNESATFAQLKGVLLDFLRAFFRVPDLQLRFRPSYFPFTEPSAEVDIGCSRKNGELKIGQGDDWLEVLGCGMVQPAVLENCGLDCTKYQGFAFGMGVERLAMLKYGIPDLRTFYDADLRWLKHYGFSALDVPSLTRGI